MYKFYTTDSEYVGIEITHFDSDFVKKRFVLLDVTNSKCERGWPGGLYKPCVIPDSIYDKYVKSRRRYKIFSEIEVDHFLKATTTMDTE